MQSNRDRIKEMIEHISTFNDADPGEGISRFSYSENDAKARKYLIDICEDIGLKVRVDAVGNVFARLVGTDESLPVVMSGSHIDSVKNGGRFDGLVGSIGALEAVRVMVEEGYQPKNSIDIVFFAEEEGSNFQVPVMGSKLLTGKLTVDDIKNLDRMGDKSAENIVKGIAQSKEVPFERALFALGIRFVGETVAKKIAKSFTDIEELENADLERLINIDEIGEKIAQSIISYFANPLNRELIERLKIAGLQFSRKEEDLSGYTDKLAGQSIVISGVFTHHSRDEYKDLIEKNGGKNVGSISAKTSFILAGENMGPAKLEKAQKLGVQIMSEDEFLALIS